MAPAEVLFGSPWQAAARERRTRDVTSPFDGSTLGTVGVAGAEDVERALVAAERGAALWRRTPAHARMTIPLRAPERADQRAEDIARTIGSESGKTITGATATVSLVTTGEAERVERAIAQAGADGARTLTGGERDGTVVSPAVVADVDLRELAAVGDVLTPYAPLGEETRHLVDEPLLARVKPGAVLVTCGRGGLLGPDAALAALESALRRVWDWTCSIPNPLSTIRCSTTPTWFSPLT